MNGGRIMINSRFDNPISNGLDNNGFDVNGRIKMQFGGNVLEWDDEGTGYLRKKKAADAKKGAEDKDKDKKDGEDKKEGEKDKEKKEKK